MTDNYFEAGRRLFTDGTTLFGLSLYGTATHLFGLSAECALKNGMQDCLRAREKVRRKHLPELVGHARLFFQGRRKSAIGRLLKSPKYMENWVIDNRYWADAAFNKAQCEQFQSHALRTLKALGRSL